MLGKFPELNQGTPYTASDAAIALSAGWGSTAAVSLASGYDSVLTFTVTPGGTGIAINPTITITFKDGTWGNAPGCLMNQTGGNDVIGDVFVTQSATAPVFTWLATPTTGKTYSFTMLCPGGR